MKITEFLLARIAEDEAGNITRGFHTIPDEVRAEAQRLGADAAKAYLSEWVRQWFRQQPARPRSARIVRECEAKRRIVERAHTGGGWLVWTPRGENAPRIDCGDDCTDWLGGFVLRSLAAVYADHPDYDPTWSV